MLPPDWISSSPAPAPGSPALPLSHRDTPSPPPQGCFSPCFQPAWWGEVGVNATAGAHGPAGQMQMLPDSSWRWQHTGNGLAGINAHPLTATSCGCGSWKAAAHKPAPPCALRISYSNEAFSQGFLVKGHTPGRIDLPVTFNT